MPNLYIITGPAGVGKSTISNMIAESKEKSALIEGDTIYHQVIGGYEVAWKEGNHLDTFWKVCIRLLSIAIRASISFIEYALFSYKSSSIILTL